MSIIARRSTSLRQTRLFLALVVGAAAFALATNPASAQQEERDVRDESAEATASAHTEVDAIKQEIETLQEQLIALLSGEPSVNSQRMAELLREKISAARTKLEWLTPARTKEPQEVQIQQAEIAELQAALQQREAQLAAVHAQLAQVEREREAQSVENAEVRIFRLKNINAGVAADTIDSVVPGRMRLAVDANTNAVVASASAETMETIEALLTNLDVERPADGQDAPASSPSQKSLLIRVILLAGANDGEGQPANSILPQSVLAAVEKLGFAPDRVLGQSVCTVTGSDDSHARFSSQTDVMVAGAPVMLRCGGYLGALNDNAAPLDLEISLQSSSINTQVTGSLTTPLGHYMVLGTANAVSPTAATRRQALEQQRAAQEREFAAHRPADEAGATERTFGGGRGGFGGGPGSDNDSGMPLTDEERGRSGRSGTRNDADAQAAGPEYQTSRFVFVVQVLEAESFAPEATQ